MGWFDDSLEHDADGLLEAFGETVIYRPSGGARRSIQAVIDREPLQTDLLNGMIQVPTIHITVKNHPRAGIDVETLTLRSDTIDIAMVRGAARTETPITRLVRHDDGMLTIAVVRSD